MRENFAGLERRIGINFKNTKLLLEALTHRSYLNENPSFQGEHNERLEFLGDAVLELVVTEYLFKNYPNPEGELTNWRAALVNARTLADVATAIDLNDSLMLSRGEARDQGRARQVILANALEALIGAIYLDKGYKKSKQFIEKFVVTLLEDILSKKLYRDPKSLFQEAAQERLGITPVYRVLKEWGPDHAKNFSVGVYLGEELVAEGEGFSKQSAEEQAAARALEIKTWS